MNQLARYAQQAWRRTVGRLRVVRVSGESMAPTLRSGDWLLVDSGSGSLPDTGELVVVRHPRQSHLLVKRVRSRGRETFAVGSDDPCAGQDSRHFGSLDASHLVGRVLWARGV